MKRLIYIIIPALLVSACIYPIDADRDFGGFEGVAIEGTITVGDTATFHMQPLVSLNHGETSGSIKARYTVEDDHGNKWSEIPELASVSTSNAYGSIDLSDADPSHRFRLHATDLGTGESYVSSWVKVQATCVIDSLSCQVDSLNSQLVINLSLHGDGGEGYYRLFLQEDWEYHADYYAWLSYIPNNRWSNRPGEIIHYSSMENTYYCWKKNTVSKLNVFDSQSLSSDRIVDKPVMKIDRSDKKISYIYRLSAAVMGITAEHHQYLEHLATISDYNGNLFSPNPSEMHGNIRNESDSTKYVAGYIGAGNIVKVQTYYENEKVKFYKKAVNDYAPLEEVASNEFQKAYWDKGLRPVYGEELTGWYWAPLRCVDCTSDGGTKERPEDWINIHN